MPRIPKNNQPQQAPVQSQQGGNVRAGTAQPTSAPAMEQQLASAANQPQAVANQSPPVQSQTGGNVRNAAEQNGGIDLGAAWDTVTGAAQAGYNWLTGGGSSQQPSAQQSGSQQSGSSGGSSAVDSFLSWISQLGGGQQGSSEPAQPTAQQTAQGTELPTIGPEYAWGTGGSQGTPLGGDTTDVPRGPDGKPITGAGESTPPQSTDTTPLNPTQPAGEAPAGTGGGSGGGSGEGPGAGGAPGVDTGATATDPYAQTISDYQTQAQQIIDTLSGLTDAQLAAYAESTGQTIEAAKKQIDDILASLQAAMPEGQAGRVGRVDTVEEENLLQQIMQAAQQQAEGRIDYGVQQAVDQLTRAQEDAKSQFQTMRDQIAANEATALDNQALYAEARGDRGGIGQAQYGSIQNTAATNQLTVNREQTKLATDTARQIADLRAQGEFQKADQLLSLTQSYLSQLMELKQWADSTNVGIDEFNIGVEKWEQEFQQQVAQIMGGMQLDALQYTTGLDLGQQETLLQAELSAAQQEAGLGMDVAGTVAGMQMTATQQMVQRQAQAAEQMIAAGITPTDQQLEALGWNRDQYDAYQYAVQMAQQAAAGGGASGEDSLDQTIQYLLAGGVDMAVIEQYLRNQTESGLWDAADVQAATSRVAGVKDRGVYQGYADYDFGNVDYDLQGHTPTTTGQQGSGSGSSGILGGLQSWWQTLTGGK